MDEIKFFNTSHIHNYYIKYQMKKCEIILKMALTIDYDGIFIELIMYLSKSQKNLGLGFGVWGYMCVPKKMTYFFWEFEVSYPPIFDVCGSEYIKIFP